MVKLVEWADGSQESIEVTDKGRILVNNQEVKAFGYNICRVRRYGIPSEQMISKILSWLQNAGVRFMLLSYSRSEAEWPAYLETWMRQLYAHKMFVLFWSYWRNDTLEVAPQYNFVKAAIEKVNELPLEQLDTIYAVGNPWEMSTHFNFEQLDTYLGQIMPMIRDGLHDSLIGGVPLLAKTGHEMWNSGGPAVVKHSDVPCWDCYPRQTHVNYGLDRIRREVLPKAGKEGYQIWLTEHGFAVDKQGKLCSGNVDPGYPPELLTRLLDSSYFPECSTIFMWILQYFDGDPRQDAGAFYQQTGEVKEWTKKIAPHFPSIPGPGPGPGPTPPPPPYKMVEIDLTVKGEIRFK